MPVFMAALGIGSSVTGLSSLSHLSFSDPSSSQYHYSPLSSLNFRSTLLKSPLRFRSLRVSVSVSDNGVAEKDTPPVGAQKSGDWEAARSYNESGLIHEGRVISGNGGGMMITFYSLVGFLPYSQLSPSHLSKEPKKPLRELAKSLAGSPIYVKVIKVDEEKRQLILSEKQASWSIYSEKIKVGDILDGRVSFVEDYGAFIDLRFPDGLYHLTGMVHASEVSWDLVQDVRDILKVGDEVSVKVFNIDKEKSRISLSIKLLEEDPLLQTLDKVIPQSESASPDSLSSGSGSDITPLPGLETIIGELLKEEGIEDVRISQQGFEKRVVSQDLQLWLSNAPPVDKQFTLLARAGRQVQEILLSTSLDQEGIKKALQHVLERVP